MPKQNPTLHESYMAVAFRPVINADGSVGMVGMTQDSPICINPDAYPNLLLAAPAMYQQLTLLRDAFDSVSNMPMPPDVCQSILANVHAIETVLNFALAGYMMPSIDTSQMGKDDDKGSS